MEDKELKYPIKYAVMPIKGQTGWYNGLNSLEREYSVIANIVSKCYVIGERKKYLSDGTEKVEYEVVFPYKQDTVYNEFKSTVPEYNIYSQCTNSIFVNQLFDDFKEAEVVADKANKEIFGHAIGFLPYNEELPKKVKEEKEKHQETLDRYKKFEETFEQETSDMKITKTYSFSLEDIIEKIVERPTEFYTKLAEKLSFEEREYLKRLIKHRACNNCTNQSCRVEHYEKVGLDEFGKPQGSSCLGWDNKKLIGKQLILTKTNR